MKSAQLNLVNENRNKIWSTLIVLLKAIFFLILVMEIKHNYEIDVFKSIDFPLDNFYYAMKDKMGLP